MFGAGGSNLQVSSLAGRILSFQIVIAGKTTDCDSAVLPSRKQAKIADKVFFEPGVNLRLKCGAIPGFSR